MISKILCLFAAFVMLATPTMSALAQSEIVPVPNQPAVEAQKPVEFIVPYQTLMRGLNNKRKSRPLGGSEQSAINQFEQFLKSEKNRLDDLSVPRNKKSVYLNRLKAMYETVEKPETGFLKEAWNELKDFVGVDQTKLIFEDEEPNDARMPQNPGSFLFDKSPVRIESLGNPIVYPQQGEDVSRLLKSLKGLVSVQSVNAEGVNPAWPAVADIKADGTEIVIDQEILQIAREMNYNPVLISNFVRNHIVYEPYFGAKKGALGCLHELTCNDTDAASLTIALMRAAGIPARYKKSIAIFRVNDLRRLLGVENNNTVYAALFQSKIPVFTLSGDQVTGSIDDVDLSGVTHLALEWTFPEIFYEYDERGGNVVNALDFSAIATTEDLQAALAQFPDKQWIPVDVMIRPYQHIQKEIVPDSAGIDAQSFFNVFLQYQGSLSPVEKYVADIVAATGKDITNSAYQSVNNPLVRTFAVLPPRLPYSLASGTTGDGVPINPESRSALPASRKNTITISLIDGQSGTEILSYSGSGSEVNNSGYEVVYTGFTAQDQAIIDSYGGIHATPAELVQIKPVLRNEKISISGTVPVSIGREIITRFTYTVPNKFSHVNEKLSVAGNFEGIFMTLSRVSGNALLDDKSNPNRNSLILLEGNSALAREYLLNLQNSRETLEKAFDFSQIVNFERAVVTQNRILNTANGTPTTFDFKGLTLDATSYISDYSNRGNYKDHRKDTRLLWGLFASWYEGQLFSDVAGLSGISTVKGLQYAFAHPETYIIHTITGANESVIDTLALSDSTKANMHADVQKGNTVYTPNKSVTQDAWSGIFYISLTPIWDGTYAIGEQTGQNGGFSTDNVSVASYTNPQNKIAEYFFKLFSGNYFGYQDMPDTADTVLCNLSESNYNAIKADSGWEEKYGFPCSKQTKQYGTVEHTFIVATDGAKFYSPNKYNYWVPRATAKQAIAVYVSKFDDGKFKFNPIAGTYSYNTSFAVYFQPNSSGAATAWRVDGDILDKLQKMHYEPVSSFICKTGDKYCGDKLNWVLNKLGYPISAQKTAAESLAGTNGYYQSFIGGQVYVETEWFDEAYYVEGVISETLNSSQYALNGAVGTGGVLGFPLKDPKKAGTTVYQDFENGHRISSIGNVEDKSFKVVVEKDYSVGEYKDLMIQGLIDGFAEMGIYGVLVDTGTGVVIDQVVKKFIKKMGKKAVGRIVVRFIPGVGWALAGYTTYAFVDLNKPLYKACDADPFQNPPNSILESSKPAYYCGKLGANLAMVGLGILADVTAGKLNKLYVDSKIAASGKNRLFSRVKDENQGNKITKIFQNSSKNRTNVSELINRLNDGDIDSLIADPKFLTRLLDDQDFFTFNNNAKDLTRHTHIFQGDSSGGWHYYPMGRPGSKITNKIAGNNGVYKANAEFIVNGQVISKSNNTFFPDNWTEKEVMQAITNAYYKIIKDKSSSFVSGNTYRAVVNNIEIRIFLTLDNKIISSFPYFE